MQTERVSCTFNRGGYYHFSRRVKSDLLNRYKYPRVVKGLHARSAAIAKKKALVPAAKLNEYCSLLRMTDPESVDIQRIKAQPKQSKQGYSGTIVSLQKAMDVYLTAKDKN